MLSKKHIAFTMIKDSKYLLLHGILFALLTCRAVAATSRSQSNANTKSYIVYMGDKPADEISTSLLHTNLLQAAFGSDVAATKSVRYTYQRSFSGMVIDLTEEEAAKMSEMDGVVSLFPNEKKHLHTTRSWNFLGLSEQVKRSPSEGDIIIGVLDSGIWPESKSFNDKGLGPPPKKWKGSCKTKNITCNNKIIGAKYYNSDNLYSEGEFASPRDLEGHGTHTASTAAGRVVNRASLYGLGSGKARGGVPSARIAAYKICWFSGCADADILAAFDDAIADGVDIISLSVGGLAREYFRDSISIGAYHAMKKGILTVASAGNDGPIHSTVANIAPWSISVAASTLDRKFVTKVKLGNNKVYEGVSVNPFDLKNKMYPLIYGADAANTSSDMSSRARYCSIDSLDSNLVKGKILLCDMVGSGFGAFNAGAVGTVMRDQYPFVFAKSFPLPASSFEMVDGNQIFSYINITSAPTATIYKSTEGIDTLAPYVYTFSSRGPNPITPDILKPDLAAPGVNILAAWTSASSITGIEGDNRIVQYNMISGTSMACPHVSASAAYVKSFHPSWSPAAIQSALMTTALPMNSGINLEAELAYGSGQVNPVKAVDPGLIYDAEEIDYIKFLCGQGYSTKLLRLVTGDNATCSDQATNATVWDLNYPSFALSTSPSEALSHSFKRTVTNVGSPKSTYRATVTAPTGSIKIQVTPSVLSFTSVGQKLSFELMIEGKLDKSLVSASLEWNNGEHKVRSPIIVFGSIP